MRNIIIVTHGDMAQGIKHTIEFIMGKQKRLHIISAYTPECLDFKKELREMVDNYLKKGEVIILTDLFGGSVNNDSMKLLEESEDVFLIAGVNLPLAIQLLLANGNTDIKTVIKKSIDEAKSGIVFCNDLIGSDDENEKIGFDDF